MTIDLRKFRHVVETARYESVTRASEILNITQSALTRSIADVETELGVQLFIRLPRGVRLTEAGASFVDRALRILGDVDNLLSGVADYRSLRTGHLRLGIAPAGYQRFVVRPVAKLAMEHENLAIEVVTGSIEALAPRLTAGEFDAIVGHANLLRRWPDLDVTPIAEFSCAVMLRRDHPLAGQKRITEADVLAYPLILPSTVEPLQNAIAALCARNGLPPPNPQYICDDFNLVSEIVRNTDAYTTVISLNPTFGHLRQDYMLLEREIELPPQRLALAVSKSRERSPAAIAIENNLREATRHSTK